METLRLTLILRFDEIYECISIAAYLLNKTDITDDSGISEPFDGVLETGNRRDLIALLNSRAEYLI